MAPSTKQPGSRPPQMLTIPLATHPTKLQFSRGGGLFRVDAASTIEILDSDEEAELTRNSHLTHTATTGVNDPQPPHAPHEAAVDPAGAAASIDMTSTGTSMHPSLSVWEQVRRAQGIASAPTPALAPGMPLPPPPPMPPQQGAVSVDSAIPIPVRPAAPFAPLPVAPGAVLAAAMPGMTAAAPAPPPLATGPVGVAPVDVAAQDKGGLTERSFRNLVKQNVATADADVEAETPPEMTARLMPHQKRALEWMSKRESPMVLDDDDDVIPADEECLGGILADEQGLGKTLSMIALMLKNKPGLRQPRVRRRRRQKGKSAQGRSKRVVDVDQSDDDETDDDDDHNGSQAEESDGDSDLPSRGQTCPPWRTLVVCPLSLMHQWQNEVLSNIGPENLPAVMIYHGAKRTRNSEWLEKHDVVITTYSTLVVEYPKVLKDLPENELRRSAKLDLLRRPAGPLFGVKWRRVVLDEAQHVKNRNTESWAAVMSLKAEVRWCITGTPITNSVDDIYSLFCFVRYMFVPNYEMWNQRWKKRLEHASNHVRVQAFQRFQTVCGVVVLRRTKHDKISGKPIVTLPKRLVEVSERSFDDKEEAAVYQAVQEQSVLSVNKFLVSGTPMNYGSFLVILLRLRQACCHPFLIEYSRMLGTRGEVEGLDSRFATPYTQEQLEETRDLMNAGESQLNMFEPSVRERIETALKPPDKKMGAVPLTLRCPQCDRNCTWGEAVFISCGHMFCRWCIEGMKAGGGCMKCGILLGLLSNADEIRMEVHARTILGGSLGIGMDVKASEFRQWVREELERKKRERGMGGDTNGSGMSNGHPNGITNGGENDKNMQQQKRKLLDALAQHSTKMRLILKELNQTRDRGGGEKTLIFSQWTTMLDIIQFHIELNGHRTCRLDGTLNIVERQKEIETFRSDENRNVLLISLHAGGTGLNLTMASRVILTDVWWNPSVEEQAIDRVHRIGQTRDIHVTRFKMKGTVEEKIYTICESKRSKVAGALGESSAESLGRRKLTMAEMMLLFTGTAEEVASRAHQGSAVAEAAENILNAQNQNGGNWSGLMRGTQ